jgi:hypothetical protein
MKKKDKIIFEQKKEINSLQAYLIKLKNYHPQFKHAFGLSKVQFLILTHD